VQRHRLTFLWAAALAVGACAPGTLVAQVPSRDSSAPAAGVPLAIIGSDAEDRARLEQLAGLRPTAGFLLRSPSAQTPHVRASARAIRWQLVAPVVTTVVNTELPFSLNDGALWAGRGVSVLATGGVRARRGRVHLTVAPALVYAENESFEQISEPIFTDFFPPVPIDRSPYASPFNVKPNSIDMPWRYGAGSYTRLDPGQSALWVDAGAAEVGIASENQWWGPGIRNALVMSNNAAGFPHLFLRTAAPLRTGVGTFEGRWLVGLLSQSPFFDAPGQRPVADEYRSLSALALTWQPEWEPDLTLGFTRVVYAPLGTWAAFPTRLFDVFANTGRPNARPNSDATQSPGRDQLFSLFGRWVFPRDGFEAYAEWARTEVPASVRDFLIAPSHTRGYTAGLQWLQPAAPGRGTVRLQAEVTNAEQSATYRDRPMGSWYTSRRVLQGYTQRGEVIGASIGPGASSQWAAADYVAPRWQAGVFAGRIRWNDDAFYFFPRPEWGGSCEHDVSVFPGARGSYAGRVVTVAGSLTFGNRLNLYNQNSRGCPRNSAMRDVRNTTLTLSFSPTMVR